MLKNNPKVGTVGFTIQIEVGPTCRCHSEWRFGSPAEYRTGQCPPQGLVLIVTALINRSDFHTLPCRSQRYPPDRDAAYRAGRSSAKCLGYQCSRSDCLRQSL